ncbi:unnamed protein product [Cyclocybe aegerita]|uniref:DUF6699 domain-containing protein n=1 Tax=Cyclocybe aegerita TaxID=1973307 RepID=A0A8S0W8F8_CYCAE|nr:unnamed protein product [Cyclocybe aegerita]
MPVKVPKQVRFAYKNILYSPPAALPALSHSVSTNQSSLGPITPPSTAPPLPRASSYHGSKTPSHNPHYYAPQVPSYAPQKAPSPSRHSATVRPHHYLENAAVVWDLIDSPASITRHHHLVSSSALREPATSPALSALYITSPYLPWTIKVYPSNGRYVTVGDVFDYIYRSLRMNITSNEWNSFPTEHDQRRATRAYEHRYRRLRSTREYEEEKRSGMKRVDFLMGRTRFVGISPSSRRPDEWHLSVT